MMKIWLQRVSALICLSLGIALIFFSYNSKQSGYVESEIVSLIVEENIDIDSLNRIYKGIVLKEIDGSDLQEEKFPCLWNVFNALGEEWKAEPCLLEDWNSFQKTVFKEESDTNLVLYHDVLAVCIQPKDGSNMARIEYIGRYNPYIKELTANDLEAYPTTFNVLKGIKNGTIDYMSNSIPQSKWFKMVDKYLDPLYDSQKFIYQGVVYGPEFGYGIENKEASFPQLPITLKIIGLVLLSYGLLLFRKLYLRKKGFVVYPKKVAILYDFITLLFAVPSAWLLAGILLKKLFFIPPIFTDNEIEFIGAFFFCIGIPFISRFTSRSTSKQIEN